MSQNDMIPYRNRFDAACESFGWLWREIEVPHERDSSCSTTDQVWLNALRERLFAEFDLTETMVKEIIRLSGVK